MKIIIIMGGNGYEEGIKGVDLVCGLRKVGVRIGMKYIKTKPLHSGPLLVRDIVIINIHDTSGHKARGRGGHTLLFFSTISLFLACPAPIRWVLHTVRRNE